MFACKSVCRKLSGELARINIHENSLAAKAFVAICKSFFIIQTMLSFLQIICQQKEKKKSRLGFFPAPLLLFFFQGQLML